MDPRTWQVLREGLIESYKHRDVAGATCCVCGAGGVPMASRIIDYAFPVGAQEPDGFISASSSFGTIRGGFPVCVVCAPPCGRCGLPVRTKRVRARFAELSKGLHSSNSPLAWGNGSCDHLWHWSRLELLGIVRLPEPKFSSPPVPRRPAVPAQARAAAVARVGGGLHAVAMSKPSSEFLECWAAAGRHIQRRGEGAVSWLKATPTPPFLEHLSFRLGNQVFFVRVEDADGRVTGPGSLDGLERVAQGCRGFACVMPMRLTDGEWRPVKPGWGLEEAGTGRSINPPDRVDDELVPLTDWELQDFAVQIVRQGLESDGAEVMSWASDPEVDPAIWFKREGEVGWVVVRSARYPHRPTRPQNLDAIKRRCLEVDARGYFAAVAAANSEDPELPLWRGHGYQVSYQGLRSLD